MTPKPHYTIWDALNVSLALGTRALEEIRVLARAPGPAGQDGTAGINGKDGQDGTPGRDGIDGKDGVPGVVDTAPLVTAMFDRLREERLGLDERLFSARKRFEDLSDTIERRLAEVKDGEQGPPGADGSPGIPGAPGRDGMDGISGEARGKYDPAENYRRLDRVSFNGSEWIARQDQPGILPGDGWMLGAQGKRGRPGVGIQAAAVKNYAIVLELDNGKAITVDLRGMFERYHEERGE